MKLLSLNISPPRQIEFGAKTVRTGICKEPVNQRLAVLANHISGDGQADLEAHGGTNKAIYAYPAEHYPHWQEMLKRPLPPGQFGRTFRRTTWV